VGKKNLSAGLLMYRRREGHLEVLLAHPGGPFWANKDEGAWTIPKGLVDEGEGHLATAKREFQEELGAPPNATKINQAQAELLQRLETLLR